MAVRSEPRNLEEIRHRAYELYEASGREDGHDLDDWLRAAKKGGSTTQSPAKGRFSLRPRHCSALMHSQTNLGNVRRQI
jgi:Protein of unknown function (DUF2934)